VLITVLEQHSYDKITTNILVYEVVLCRAGPSQTEVMHFGIDRSICIYAK